MCAWRSRHSESKGRARGRDWGWTRLKIVRNYIQVKRIEMLRRLLRLFGVRTEKRSRHDTIKVFECQLILNNTRKETIRSSRVNAQRCILTLGENRLSSSLVVPSVNLSVPVSVRPLFHIFLVRLPTFRTIRRWSRCSWPFGPTRESCFTTWNTRLDSLRSAHSHLILGFRL